MDQDLTQQSKSNDKTFNLLKKLQSHVMQQLQEKIKNPICDSGVSKHMDEKLVKLPNLQ